MQADNGPEQGVGSTRGESGHQRTSCNLLPVAGIFRETIYLWARTPRRGFPFDGNADGNLGARRQPAADEKRPKLLPLDVMVDAHGR